jgi:alkanesulfonate monooxygenase SsuD/methylene tetrahydromethanopterin reductase-like flavin-dependent oxidoreductase (luciferase family)
MEEVIEIIRMLWEGDEINYTGKYYTLNNVRMPVKPFKKRRLPIWIACSVSDTGLRRVARLADGWIGNIVTPEELQESWNKVGKYAKGFGRDQTDIEPCHYLYVNLDSDKEKSYNEADKFLTAYYNTKFTPEILARWGSFGNAKDCVRRIESTAAAGVRTIIVHFASLDPLKKLEIFTKDVLPSFS